MNKAGTTFSGTWRSKYSFHSSSRNQEFEYEHLVRMHQKGDTVVAETFQDNANKSYVLIRLTLDGDVATGSWQEETDSAGYYKGATYYGAIQFTIDTDKRHMTGKWLGFGKDGDINTGPWELTKVSG